jgi:hypothetical protein
MCTTTHINANPVSAAGSAEATASHVAPAEVLDLSARIKQLEQSDRSWPGADGRLEPWAAGASEHGAQPPVVLRVRIVDHYE